MKNIPLTHKLISFLFPKTYRGFVEAEEQNQKKIKAVIEGMKKVSYTDTLREQLTGFNPKLLDGAGDDKFNPDEMMLAWVEKEGRSITDFLAQCHELKGNWALPMILDWVIRGQILHTALRAPSLEATNFGRATVNGVSLVREEVIRMDAEYEERKNAPKPDKVDEHAAL